MFESVFIWTHVLTPNPARFCNVQRLGPQNKNAPAFPFKEKQTFPIEFDMVSLGSVSSLATNQCKKQK